MRAVRSVFLEMKTLIDGMEVSVHGRVFRTAKLRHEWCDFLPDPPVSVKQLREKRPIADLFTFTQEVGETKMFDQFHREMAGASVLTISSHEKWFAGLDGK